MPAHTADDQITLLVNQVAEETDPGLEYPDPNAPQVAIRSVLALTREQEQRLSEWVWERYTTIGAEMGRQEILDNTDSGAAQPGDMAGVPADPLKSQDFGRGFLAKRRMYELLYNLKVEWREFAYGGIFAETNYPVPMTRRLVQQQVSRAQNYFFATDPWFTAGPEGRSDSEVAKEVDRYAKYKSRRQRIAATKRQAIRAAFVRGEGVLKTSYVDERDVYETITEVAIDQQGNQILADDGDYIYPEDAWDLAPVLDEMGQPVLNEMGQPVLSNQWVLRRDGATKLPVAHPDQLTFARQRVRKELILRRGATMDLVHYTDFLCPLNAPSVQEADFVAHVYERPALHIAQQVLGQNNEDRQGVVLSALRELTHASTQSKTGQMKELPEVGEYNSQGHDHMGNTQREPRVKIAECYVRFDVDGDGVEESLFVLIDTENEGRLLYADYLANVTPDGRRPFHVVRCNVVDNRWYGLSQVELFEDQQKLVDLFLNRVVKATSDQASVKFWRPEWTVEGDANPNLQYNDGTTYTPKDQHKGDEILQVVPVYEPRIQELMQVVEFVQQNTLNLSGVTGSNDAAAAGLDTQKTATGIRNIDRTGQELFGPFLGNLEEGLVSAMQAWIALELFYLDGAEVYEYFEGDTRMVAELTKEKVRNLAVDVRLELTRYRNEQEDLQATQAIEIVNQFYAQPPDLQQITAPLYRQLLKRREISDADMLIQPGAVMPMMPMGGVDDVASAAVPSAENPVTPVGPPMPGQTQANY